ncbi:dep domain-containing protein 7 [Plakobranchus ocellatus]|uniref:Dep domain-containing protein 7 n=1 Tax=Plakobranchus ocellatus TaxID=259542 RepID=A0AAV4DEN5_9GAST|nr:dep domain-containing protein 7 [Plakobranchus ocellatus]
MRHIESCFTGTDAVDVVLHFLLNDQDTFSSDLSREKASKVCQMLMQRKVFHSATERAGSEKANVFEDSSSKLFHLTEGNKDVCGNVESAEDEETGGGSVCDTTQNTTQSSENFRLFNTLEPAEEPSLEDEVQISPLYEIKNNIPGTESSSRKTSVSSADDKLGISTTWQPSRTLSGDEVEEVWREVALTQLLTHVELNFLDGILGEDSGDHKSMASARRQQQRHHLIISNLVARSWHLPLTPGSSLGNTTSDPLLVTAMDCIEFLPNGGNILNDPIFKRRGHEAKVWAKDIIVKHFKSLGESLLPQRYLELHMAILNQLLSGALENALACLQLYMILLPISSREELYRLLKFMRSLSADTTVVIDPQMSNEMAALSLLSDCIFHHKLLATNVAQKLVQFMMNNVDQVFTVPRRVREKVAIKLYQLKTGKTLLACESSFCSRVSKEEFERQSKSCTENSLIDLMNSVLDDIKMSLKEKKSRLKQFQKSYPQLYDQHFDGML